MDAVLTDAQIIQGISYQGEFALTWPEPTGGWPDLVGKSGSFTMKAVTEAERFTKSVSFEAGQQAKLELTKLETVDFTPGLYEYRITAELGEDEEVVIAEGRLRVRPKL